MMWRHHLLALRSRLLTAAAPSQPPNEGGTPEARPLPQIPGQRPSPEDRIHRVELCAALRGTSEHAIGDWRDWEREAEEAPYVTELVARMERHEAEGRGW